MLFHSSTFAIFFTIMFAIYWAAKKKFALQNAILIVSSYVFYGWWDTRFLVLVALSTVTDYITGIGANGLILQRVEYAKCTLGLLILAIALYFCKTPNFTFILTAMFGYAIFVFAYSEWAARFEIKARKSLFLGLSVVANLGTLGFFKYFNFFAENLQLLVGQFGLHANYTLLKIILPVGLSFYTFQTMSYTIDSYRGLLQPTRRISSLAAFIAFFPQLVAGPIERAKYLLPQFETQRSLTIENLKSGALLFLWGLYKKMVIADNLAPIADKVFDRVQSASPSETTIAILAFMFQIYCDFSAYSDMARGSARVLGFDLSLNFKLPYFSRSPSEFWTRWHISLSSWLRDYLYIPLGGNKNGTLKTYRNLIVTMLLGGLWHGASWTFVAWGSFHGALLVFYRFTKLDRVIAAAPKNSASGIALNLLAMAVMFAFTAIGWVLFRSRTMPDAIHAVSNIGLPHLQSQPFISFLFFLTPLLLAETYQFATGQLEFINKKTRFIQYTIVLFLLFSILFLSAEQSHQFIYFDF